MNKKQRQGIGVFTHRAFAVFLTVFLISEAGTVYAGEDLEVITQEWESSPYVTRVEAEKLTDEGLELLKQGTAESLIAARKKFEAALVLWRKLGDKQWEANILVGIGKVDSDLGENQKALKYYNQALPLYRVVDDKGGEANTLSNIGQVYSDLGEKQEALKFLNQALPLYRVVSDRAGEASTLNNIGFAYSGLGENQKALEFFKQVLPLVHAVGDKSGEANTLSNIGSVYSELGEKQKALEFFNQALSLARAASDRAKEAAALNNIGQLYSDLGEKQRALEFFKQTLTLFRAMGDRRGEAVTLNNIADVYDALGKKQLSLEYFKQALPLARAVGNRALEAVIVNNIATAHFDLGEKHKALEFFNKALLLTRAIRDKSTEATTLSNIGAVYSDLGEKHKALKFLNQALPLSRAVGEKSWEANTLWNLADLERKQGNLQASRKHIETAIKIIEELRGTYTNQDLKTSYFATVQDYYKFYIDLLMELHKKDPSKGYDKLALNASERSRARGLLDLLKESNAKIRKGANPELLRQERDLLQQITARETLRQQLESSASKDDDPITKQSIQRLIRERENLLSQYQEVQTKIRTTSPGYVKLINPDPDKDILKLPQIQQQLDQDTLLLQYSLGNKRSYLWAVTANSLDTYELPGRETIEKSANKFKELLKKCQQPLSNCQDLSAQEKAKDFQEITQAATELSKQILSPVAGKLGKKPLVIVADGVLQEIPFSALSQPNQKSSQPEKSNYQPLLINHEIVNLPSVTAIATHRQSLHNRRSAPKTLAVLADPVFTANDDRLTGKSPALVPELDLERSNLKRSAKNLNRTEWNRLPGTRTEAEEILKLVSPSQSLHAFDFAANYNFATSEKLKQYRYILFATHGFADPVTPELSGIILSQFDKQGKAQTHSTLRLGDIFNLDWNADLVVLSACETGLGKDIQGEGLMGLTRGLMYAGAQTAVVSLWQVNDSATSQLMPLFYTAMLQQNISAPQALRQAQLKLWEENKWQNPYYWAAFTLQGEWR